MRVLLDTNVILDAMLSRPPWQVHADAILQAAADGRVSCAATAHSVDAIVTRDPSGFADSTLTVLTPEDLLQRQRGAIWLGSVA